jgi:hypothetical protein
MRGVNYQRLCGVKWRDDLMFSELFLILNGNDNHQADWNVIISGPLTNICNLVTLDTNVDLFCLFRISVRNVNAFLTTLTIIVSASQVLAILSSVVKGRIFPPGDLLIRG